GNKVNSLVVDLDGSIWVGTDRGPVVFDCGDPFSESCRGNTRKVIVDGIPALLLRDEDILSIEVDGGNRKWFGTRNGIFVQSPDGITQEAKFDVRNSPLLDNKVTDLGFNTDSGEMFVISTGGIQSYKTETTGGGRSHSTNVYAFPNPVRPDYTGPIAIKGLVRDANVKITDINGRLVYETKALGGQAVWDGNDYNGVRAASGIYLVFSANENTSQSSDAFVTKIMIVN
ncbi:MAG: regulator, partial [Saprospiraceae bacterium]|nr:regulator [Saprospiraceae bacterium]